MQPPTKDPAVVLLYVLPVDFDGKSVSCKSIEHITITTLVETGTFLMQFMDSVLEIDDKGKIIFALILQIIKWWNSIFTLLIQ